MKILLINTYYKTGGAAVACKRLLSALNAVPGVSAKMLVQDNPQKPDEAVSVSSGLLGRIASFLRFVRERLTFLPFERSSAYRYLFSLANTGIDPQKIRQVREADLIHIHWFNQGLLSLSSLRKLKKLKKPVVFTLHDMWLFTGGCHYSGSCRNYITECRKCPMLRFPSEKDLSTRIFRKKEKLFAGWSFQVVTCSNWLRLEAQKGKLLSGKNIVTIPNPIDTDVFKAYNQEEARKALDLDEKKKYVLFGAMKVNDPRKGFLYFAEALEHLKNENIELLVFGKADPEDLSGLLHKVHFMGSVTSTAQLALIYAAADVFVLPSLEDNLPNTVMESMSCGTPVVAFDTGGIPDLIDHETNGYLAKLQDSRDLAGGIQYVLSDRERLSENSRKKVEKTFSMQIPGEKYLELYKQLLRAC